jgi:hypothetical protein
MRRERRHTVRFPVAGVLLALVACSEVAAGYVADSFLWRLGVARRRRRFGWTGRLVGHRSSGEPITSEKIENGSVGSLAGRRSMVIGLGGCSPVSIAVNSTVEPELSAEPPGGAAAGH